MFKPGDRFYSEFFRSWGTVTKYIDDNNWWFILDSDGNGNFNGRILKAQSKPSAIKHWIKGER